jgi:hypothetical protein
MLEMYDDLVTVSVLDIPPSSACIAKICIMEINISRLGWGKYCSARKKALDWNTVNLDLNLQTSVAPATT